MALPVQAAAPNNAAPVSEAVAKASPECLEALLRRLGWRIQSIASEQPVLAAGTPCQRASLADAQANGDLHAVLPLQWPPSQRADALRGLLADQASVCAYAFVLGGAARRASQQLQDNEGYRFSAVQLGWIGFGWRGARAQGWQRFRSFGRGYAPAARNSDAIDAFYDGHVRSECGVGRQIAQLATQRELYGDADFDREFSSAELSIGTFLTLHATDSILLGTHAGEFFADGKAVKTARLGRQAFMGVPGFIEHVYDKRYLDDIHNQAENFIVVDVGVQAAAALAAHGGLAYYDALNRQIWALATQLPGHGRRRFERLLYARDARLRARLSPAQRPILERLDRLLDDPFYREFMVYVHPKGIRPIGYHVVRLLDRNPRTPYSIELALHNLHTTLYWRWIDRQLKNCGGALPVE